MQHQLLQTQLVIRKINHLRKSLSLNRRIQTECYLKRPKRIWNASIPLLDAKKYKLKTYKHSILTSLTYLTKLIWGSTYTAKKELVGLSFGHMGLGFETVPTKIFKSRQKKRTMEKPINYI